jgi:hypothetical protein
MKLSHAALAALVAFASASAIAAEAEGAKYTYSDLAVGEGNCGMFEVGTESQFPAAIKMTIDTSPDGRHHSKRGSFWGCHSGTVLLECEDTKYYCFRTFAMHFAVPKQRGLKVGQRWTTMDTTFEVIRTEPIAYLGTHHDTYVIATLGKLPGWFHYYYWSEDAGLVAIRFVIEKDESESVDAYVLEGAKGFPF